jgi:hypothetical protein
LDVAVWALFGGLLLVALAGASAGIALVRELRARRQSDDSHRLLALFGAAAERVAADPRALLTWHPLAAAARRRFPEAFAELDRAAGAPFPFGPDVLEAAHARWTAEWLSWEREHDEQSRLRVAAVEAELDRRGEAATPIGRARLAGLERVRLEQYQQRYEEYRRVARALAAFGEEGAAGGRAVPRQSSTSSL